MLVNGLVPGLAEVGEAVLHYTWTGHLAHTADDRGDLGDQGCEHGCGTTQHHCACCATTQAVAPSCGVVIDSPASDTTEPLAPVGIRVASREPMRPFRPPI